MMEAKSKTFGKEFYFTFVDFNRKDGYLKAQTKILTLFQFKSYTALTCLFVDS